MPNKTKITQMLIVDVALDIAKESGVEAITMANIARQLQIKSPSLYNHFLSLYDIKQAAAYKAQTILFDYLLENNKQDKSTTLLKSFAISYYQFACQHPGYYEVSIIALDASKGTSILPSSGITNMMKALLEPYKLDEEMTIHTIRALRSMLHGLIDLNNKGGFKLEVNIEQTLHHAIDLFIRGIEVK